MKSFETRYLDNLPIPHRLLTTIRQIGEYKGKQDLYKQQAPEMLENLRHVAMIQSTESSNRLEGITAEFKRIKEIVEEKVRESRVVGEGKVCAMTKALNRVALNLIG